MAKNNNKDKELVRHSYTIGIGIVVLVVVLVFNLLIKNYTRMHLYLTLLLQAVGIAFCSVGIYRTFKVLAK